MWKVFKSLENNLFCSQVREIRDWSCMNGKCNQMALFLQITELVSTRECVLMSTQLYAWEKVKNVVTEKKHNLFHKDAVAPAAERSLLEWGRNQTVSKTEGSPTMSHAYLPQHWAAGAAWGECSTWSAGLRSSLGPCSHQQAQEQTQRRKIRRLERVRNMLLSSLLSTLVFLDKYVLVKITTFIMILLM